MSCSSSSRCCDSSFSCSCCSFCSSTSVSSSFCSASCFFSSCICPSAPASCCLKFCAAASACLSAAFCCSKVFASLRYCSTFSCKKPIFRRKAVILLLTSFSSACALSAISFKSSQPSSSTPLPSSKVLSSSRCSFKALPSPIRPSLIF